jgi:hypothetical protein
MTPGDTPPEPIFAAAYVRMSTEHQQYSTSNQMDVIREYAKRRGMQIIKEYSDEGKSGLNIQGRDSLARDDQGCPGRRGEALQHSCLRCQPLGPISGC